MRQVYRLDQCEMTDKAVLSVIEDFWYLGPSEKTLQALNGAARDRKVATNGPIQSWILDLQRMCGRRVPAGYEAHVDIEW